MSEKAIEYPVATRSLHASRIRGRAAGAAKTLRVGVGQIERWALRRLILTHEAAAAEDDEVRVLAGQMEERQRLASELHDGVGQSLVALSFGLTHLAHAIPPGSQLGPVIEEMDARLQQIHAEIRTLSFLLQPLHEDGSETIEAALRNLATGFARRAGLQVQVRFDRLERGLSSQRELALFRVLQEALVNVHRHAQAGRVEVDLVERAAQVVLIVRDDGRGMSGPKGAPPEPGVGIASMRARLRKLGGELLIVTGEDGTTVTARLPG